MTGINDTSPLLSSEENDLVLTVIGNRKQSKATAVVQLFQASPDRHNWTKFRTGVACFVKDNVKKTYYIRLVDIGTRSIVFEQELFNQFTYKRDRPFFHSFPADKFMVGLNFANDQEANRFGNAVDTKIRERTEKRSSVKQARPPQPDVALISRPPIAPINDGNDPFAANRKGKPKRPRKKINKADIGLPSDFRHLAHVGFDPQTGAFDSDNITPEWKKLLDTVGVTNEQLEDKNTAEFIYDFVEKHGGIEEANRQLETARQTRAAPPPPSHHRDRGLAPPSRNARGGSGRGLPPPPPRGDSAPPPPSRHGGPPPPGGNIPPPPPPPPIGVPAPPPPPPPANTGGPPPPPAKRSGGGGPPPPPAPPSARSNLLSSIRAGVQLKARTQAEEEEAAAAAAAEEDLDGMAGALVRALAMRSNVIHQSDNESGSGEESDEDEWD